LAVVVVVVAVVVVAVVVVAVVVVAVVVVMLPDPETPAILLVSHIPQESVCAAVLSLTFG
jgi:hypothetical protein